VRVDIWSDIICPWCYLGKSRFEKGLAAFEHRDQVQVVYRSFELDPGPSEPLPVLDVLARKYGVTGAQAQAMEARVASGAAEEGLGFADGRLHGNTFDMHRLLHLAKHRGVPLLDALYQAHFAEARPVFDTETLVGIAAGAGLDTGEARKVLAGDDYADEVRADEREAKRLGISGVPFFVIDGKYGISGGQPAGTFTAALNEAWQHSAPVVPAPVDVCADDVCAVPERSA
jgi:predicted DsbA family dithiol-disulfide isomerase